MLKSQVGKRVAAGFTAAILASAMMVPAVAFGEDDSSQQPEAKAEYETSGTGNATTELHLILNTDLGPTNVKLENGNTKVVVPSKLTFVANADGSITGPAFDIENYSKFKVHVSQVGVAQTNDEKTGVGTIKQSNTTDNDVAIVMKPGVSGADHNLANYLTAAAPTAGQWNIGPATNNTAASLNVTTSGSFSKLSNITDDIAHKFGTITWTVAPGFASSSTDAPEQSGSGE